MDASKAMLMEGLTRMLHGAFIAILDTLNKFREYDTFKVQLWTKNSDMHRTFRRSGLMYTLSNKYVDVLPLTPDVSVVAGAVDEAAQIGEAPVPVAVTMLAETLEQAAPPAAPPVPGAKV